MPPKKPSSTRPQDQKSLNRFLGLPLEQVPGKLNQFGFAPVASTSASARSPAPELDDEKPEMPPKQPVKMDVDSDSDTEQVETVPKSKKRASKIASSDEEEEATPVQGSSKDSSKSPQKKKAKVDAPEPERKKEPVASPSKKDDSSKIASKASGSSNGKKTTDAKSDKPKPPVSSFFAPRKPAEPSTSASSSSSKKDDKASSSKGKGKASPEEEEEKEDSPEVRKKDDDEEGGLEGEDSEEDEEDEQTAVKMAEMFTSKRPDKESKASWKEGDPVPYAALTSTFNAISKTTKRLEISRLLTNFLMEVIQRTPNDLLKTVYLCINRLCPDYLPLELGIGESILMKAIGDSTGRKLQQVKEEFKKIGDLGEVAQASREKQKVLFKPKPLTVNFVFNKLTDIAKASGSGSQKRKGDLIQTLLAACVGVETKFLIRSLEGKLRIGLAERSVIVALSHAVVNVEILKSGKHYSSEKVARKLEEGSNILKAVFSEIPSYDLVVPALLEKGIENLKEACSLTPGIPLKPMLAKPTKAITEVLDRFEGKRFTCEYKYDGERAQVHYLEDGSIKVFSRNSEDMSVKYPDVVKQLPAAINKDANTTSFVIDCEAVAWDTDQKRLLPFQELSRRKRKDVKAEDIKVKVHLFAFDLLYLNGEPLLNENLDKRRQLLREHLQPVEEEFAFATSEDATNVEDIQIFLDKSVKEGCEGLMVKMLEGEGATYEPSRRSIHWLKLKKDYLAGVGDSFDLVVIGADFGAGKRTGVYGAFHLACFDDETQGYQAICKIGTGFSDEALKSHHERLSKGPRKESQAEGAEGEEDDREEGVMELKKKPGDLDMGKVASSNLPDVYFEPSTSMVWEVLAADLSKSPVYPAAVGKVDPEKGISLRFPRFIRIRDDKNPEQATDSEQVADAYRRQATTSAPGKFAKKGGEGEDDGFW